MQTPYANARYRIDTPSSLKPREFGTIIKAFRSPSCPDTSKILTSTPHLAVRVPPSNMKYQQSSVKIPPTYTKPPTSMVKNIARYEDARVHEVKVPVVHPSENAVPNSDFDPFRSARVLPRTPPQITGITTSEISVPLGIQGDCIPDESYSDRAPVDSREEQNITKLHVDVSAENIPVETPTDRERENIEAVSCSGEVEATIEESDTQKEPCRADSDFSSTVADTGELVESSIPPTSDRIIVTTVIPVVTKPDPLKTVCSVPPTSKTKPSLMMWQKFDLLPSDEKAADIIPDVCSTHNLPEDISAVEVFAPSNKLARSPPPAVVVATSAAPVEISGAAFPVSAASHEFAAEAFKPSKKLARSPILKSAEAATKSVAIAKGDVRVQGQHVAVVVEEALPTKQQTHTHHDRRDALRCNAMHLERLREEEEALLRRMAAREQRAWQLNQVVTNVSVAGIHHTCNVTTDSDASVDSAPHLLDDISLHKTTDFIDVVSFCSNGGEDKPPIPCNEHENMEPVDESLGHWLEDVKYEDEKHCDFSKASSAGVVLSPSVPVNLSQSLGSPTDDFFVKSCDEPVPEDEIATDHSATSTEASRISMEEVENQDQSSPAPCREHSRAVRRQDPKGTVIDIGIPYYVETGMIFEPLTWRPKHHKTVGHTAVHSKKKYEIDSNDSIRDEEVEDSHPEIAPKTSKAIKFIPSAPSPSKPISKPVSKQRKKRSAGSIQAETSIAPAVPKEEVHSIAAAVSKSPVKKKKKKCKGKQKSFVPEICAEEEPENSSGGDISLIAKSKEKDVELSNTSDSGKVSMDPDPFSVFCEAMREEAVQMLNELQPFRKGKKKACNQKSIDMMLEEMWTLLTDKEQLKYKLPLAAIEECPVAVIHVPCVEEPDIKSSDEVEDSAQPDTSISDSIAATRNKKNSKRGNKKVAEPKTKAHHVITSKVAARTPLNIISDAFTPASVTKSKKRIATKEKPMEGEESVAVEVRDTPLPSSSNIPFKRNRKFVDPAPALDMEGLEPIQEESSTDGTTANYLLTAP